VISNKKIEVPKYEYNDENKLNDVLISLKYLNTLYGNFCTESSNKALSDDINKAMKVISKHQRDAFELMFKLGWYTLEEENQTKINATYSKFSGKIEEIS